MKLLLSSQLFVAAHAAYDKAWTKLQHSIKAYKRMTDSKGQIICTTCSMQILLSAATIAVECQAQTWHERVRHARVQEHDLGTQEFKLNANEVLLELL